MFTIYQSVQWDALQDGQAVYLDHYRGGQYPKASPRLAGPFIVASKERCRLFVRHSRFGATFTIFPAREALVISRV